MSSDALHPVLDIEKGSRSETLLNKGNTYEKPEDPNIVWWMVRTILKILETGALSRRTLTSV